MKTRKRRIFNTKYLVLSMLHCAIFGYCSAHAGINCRATSKSQIMSIYDNSGGRQNEITIPRNIDSQVPIALTGWATFSDLTGLGTCSYTNPVNQMWGGIAFKASGSNTGYIYREGADSYSIYATGFNGVGYVVKRRFTTSFPQCPSSTFRPIQEYRPYDEYHCAMAKEGTVYFGAEIQIRLIKYSGSVPTDGWIYPQKILGGVASQRAGAGAFTQNGPENFELRLPEIRVKAGTCTFSANPVDLKSHKMSDLQSKGFSDYVNFEFTLRSCPSGMKRIKYSIRPTAGIQNTTEGIIFLSADSTAKGIGVQIFRNTENRPAVFNTSIVLNDYQGKSGDYTVPFRARYYKISDKLSPGSANARIEITMSYE